MTFQQEQISHLEEEVVSARRDFQETLSAVETKVEREVERAEDAFSPQKLLRDNLVGAACVAGLFGFLVGSSKYRKVVVPAILVGVGYAIWSGLSNQESDDGG
jgi:hypothetical protein